MTESQNPRPRWRSRVGAVLLWGGVAAGVGLPVGGVALDRVAGREVRMISPHEASVVEANRALWSPGEPVAEIYGVPAREPARIVFADPAKVIVPAEDPSLTLLAVDKQAGDNPLQAQSVWFAVKLGAPVGILAAIVGLLVRKWNRISRNSHT